MFSHATIWSGVPALITGVKSSVVAPLICPYTMELMKLTRARLVLVLKMANSGPFKVVCGINDCGGKKLNTLAELKSSCRHGRAAVRESRAIGSGVKGAGDAYFHYDGFAKLSVGADGGGRRVAAPGFRIQQNGGQRGLHVAAFPRTIAIEFSAGEGLRHALHVGGAGIAGHQLLDQLRGDEWRKIWMIEDYRKNGVQFLFGGLPRGDGLTEKCLCAPLSWLDSEPTTMLPP